MCSKKIDNLSLTSKYYRTVKTVDKILDKERRLAMPKFEEKIIKKAFEMTNEQDIQYRTPEYEMDTIYPKRIQFRDG
jgi:hypothetical protein